MRTRRLSGSCGVLPVQTPIPTQWQQLQQRIHGMQLESVDDLGPRLSALGLMGPAWGSGTGMDFQTKALYSGL
jgi:hypothetical protein